MEEHSKGDVLTTVYWRRWDAADQCVIGQLGISCSHQMVI